MKTLFSFGPTTSVALLSAVRENIDDTLATRARELARTLAGRNHIAIDTSADEVENTVLAAAREYSAQALSKDMRSLREVEAARKRLRNGVYSFCLRCDEEIAPKRLQVIRWAAACHVMQGRDGRTRPATRAGLGARSVTETILETTYEGGRETTFKHVTWAIFNAVAVTAAGGTAVRLTVTGHTLQIGGLLLAWGASSQQCS